MVTGQVTRNSRNWRGGYIKLLFLCVVPYPIKQAITTPTTTKIKVWIPYRYVRSIIECGLSSGNNGPKSCVSIIRQRPQEIVGPHMS